MKVMMIQIPHFYDNSSRIPAAYPLGIGYLASTLKDVHDAVPMDLWIENANIDKAMRMIAQNVPDVFCVSVYSTQYPYFRELVLALRNAYPHIKIIAGGPGATFSYKTLLEKTPVDFCVIGEGEMTLMELLANMNNPGDIAGIAYKKDNRLFLTARREQIADLDALPLPDRNFFDMERYVSNSMKAQVIFKKMRTTNIIAGRGCPYKCTFCSKTFSGIRLRSVGKIIEEIELLKNIYKITAMEFNDELVVINKKRIMDLCASLKGLDIKWGCQGRIDAVDEETVRAMKAAHCSYIGYGVESSTQTILDSMKKQIRAADAIPVIKMTAATGVKPIVQYMYGFPGEDDVSIENTYEFFKAIDHPYIGFTTTPLPGTELYDSALSRKLIADEEGYLMRIAAGYNVSAPIVNMTSFSDEEFISKKNALMKRVNRLYYGKHPAQFIQEMFKILRWRITFLFSNPRGFLRKLRGQR